jgi:hypothetical protein
MNHIVQKENQMHNKVSFRVAKKFAAVRKAVRKAQWAQSVSAWDGSDFEWVAAHWDAVSEARASVR